SPLRPPLFSASGLPESSSMHLNVLVVEDDVDTTDSLATLLTHWGHEARISHDGRTALVAVEDDCPDVVHFDVGMPGMSGLELASKLRVHVGRKRRMLIAVTGYGDTKMRMDVLNAGVHFHLVKPVEPETVKELLTRLRTGLEHAGEPQYADA